MHFGLKDGLIRWRAGRSCGRNRTSYLLARDRLAKTMASATIWSACHRSTLRHTLPLLAAVACHRQRMAIVGIRVHRLPCLLSWRHQCIRPIMPSTSVGWIISRNLSLASSFRRRTLVAVSKNASRWDSANATFFSLSNIFFPGISKYDLYLFSIVFSFLNCCKITANKVFNQG